MLTRLDLRGQGGDLAGRLPRPSQGGDVPLEVVRGILSDVRARGDAAVRECTERFDRVAIDGLRVDPAEVSAALRALPEPLRAALEAARDAIEAYHRFQVQAEGTHRRDGVVIRDLRAQAIGAMAYGTETIPPVDVIVGPGNVYVALAKREVAGEGRVGVPAGFAGPSEVVVVADETTPVDSAAIDVIVQAEHGPDGLAWLVTWSAEVADRVSDAVARLVAEAPRRGDIEATLAGGGYAVLVDGPEQALAVANAIAPEHLQLMCDGAEGLLPLVRHAGAVFCGPWAPAAVGDYVAGPSHVLPTFGSARFASGLRVDDFVRTIHAVTLDEEALRRVAPYVTAIAEAEGLAAHAQAVRLREAQPAS
ncbi:MAG: histidinol dehydrogenase [Actinobacteria bacterium]|nr:histidinol dehydrogenase [Actinomycetota bacterium]